MSRLVDVSDPTDWLKTSLPTLAPVDAALRCQVCKDFYNTPMITSCAHTFCSLCIRRCLALDGKCPVCRASEQEVKLRRNWTVEEVVDAFQRARPQALERARKAEEPEELGRGGGKRKRKLSDTDLENDAEPRLSQTRRTRSQTQGMARQASGGNVMVIDHSEESDYQPDDGLVACPMCNKRMKEEDVFPHLDRCGGEQKEPSTSTSTSQSRRTTSANTLPQPKPPQPTKPPDRLPQLNYSLLKDNALRKKLQELGIPNWGPRPLLIRRHTEWINVWNANCDSTKPRTQKELLKELDVWERSQGGHAANGGGLSGSTSGVMRKDFDAHGYAKSNKDNFDKLIAEARSKSTAATTTEQKPKEEVQAHTDNQDQATPRSGSLPSLNVGTQTPDSATQANGDPPAHDSNEGDYPDPNTPPDRPFKITSEALSNIRAKISAANNSDQTPSSQSPPSFSPKTPQLPPHTPTSGLQPEQHAPPAPPTSTQNVPTITGLNPESLTRASNGGSKIRKMPMFTASEDPVRDVEIDTGAH